MRIAKIAFTWILLIVKMYCFLVVIVMAQSFIHRHHNILFSKL